MTRNSSAAFLCALATGAAVMYLLDPSHGRRRRAVVRDQAKRLTRQARDASGTLARDVSNRLTGLAARTSGLSSNTGPATDDVVRERVRAAIGRYVAGAGAVAGITLAVLAVARRGDGRAEADWRLEVADSWDTAGFA